MKTLIIDHKNGHSTTYQLIEDGQNLPLAYHAETNKGVIDTLEYCRKNRIRVRLHYGDIETGRDWNEEHDVMGYVSMSKGHKARFPILVYNERAYGGGSILDHCIIKICAAKGKRILYKAENYQQPVFDIVSSDLPEYGFNVNINGQLYSRHKTEKQAKNLIKKMA